MTTALFNLIVHFVPAPHLQYLNILIISSHSLSHSFIESLIGVKHHARLWIKNDEPKLAHFLCSGQLIVYLHKFKK